METYPTAEKFAVEMNPDNCLVKYSSFKTLQDAFTSGKIKLVELADIYGERAVTGWIGLWLIVLSKNLNFEITEQQRSMTASFIIEELYMLNIAEFTLFFKRLLKGYYGEFYGKFNGQIIISACREYRRQRGEMIVKIA